MDLIYFWLGGAAFVLVLAVVLYPEIRYSIISSRRTRGAAQRLRWPNPDDIEELCGFRAGDDLLAFYRQVPFVERSEFTLRDGSRMPAAEWDIFEFVPITARDVAENRRISRVDGIPIAYDGAKGTYFLARDGSVMLDTPEVGGRTVRVAESITAFARFEPVNLE